MPTPGPPAVPSRNALRVLRKLALAGSTVGSFCTVAAITYDVHRRVSVAERIVENKRALQTSAPRYNATSTARRLSLMMEAAEAGEFAGLEAWKEVERKSRESQANRPPQDPSPPFDETFLASPPDGTESPSPFDDTSSNATAREDTDIAATPQPQRSTLKLSKKWSDLTPPAQPPLPSLRTHYNVRPLSKETGTATLDCNLDIPINKEMALEDRIQTLLQRAQYIDAAQIFLDEHSTTDKTVSVGLRDQVMQAFYLNCKQDNVFIARSLFERLEEVDRITPTMWKILIVSLSKKGCIESAATVYERYREIFNVPSILLDVVLRCLLESRRLTSAKWLLFRNLAKDRKCGLAGAYLSGLWKKTRNLELMNGQFGKLLTLLNRMNMVPTEKLINPMLKAYIEFGKYSDAEALVEQMQTTYLVPLSCRMKGLLVYGKALQCDWEAVDEGFEEMRQLGLTNMKEDFTRIFDRIFLEYWVSHTADEIQKFLYQYIDKFDITPDRVLYQHILEAFIEKSDEAMIAEFRDVARQRGWRVNVNENEVMDLLLRRRSALQDSPVGFWQMLHAAREEGIRATASQRILGYDQRSFALSAKEPVRGGDVPATWYNRTVDELTTPSRPVSTYQKLHHQMTHHMHVGKTNDALQCFQGAKDAGYHLKPLEIELALVATLLEHGLDRAQALMEDAWADSLPLFFRQLKDANPSADGEYLQMAIFRFYRHCWDQRDMIVKHHILASTSRRLIDSDQPDLALDLLVSVYTSKYGRWRSFDGVCMKMFLRAFAATNNLAGMRWCILTAISRDSALNRDLVVEAHRILGVIRRDAAATGVPEKMAHRLKKQLKYLDFATNVLNEKCNGSHEYADLRSIREAKESFRRKLKPTLDEHKIWQDKQKFQQVIEEWDEEYELERVLDRIDNQAESILERWNEATCLEYEQEFEENSRVYE